MTAEHFDVSVLGSVIRLQLAEDLPADFVDRVRSAWSGAQASGADITRELDIELPGDPDRRLERLSVEVTLAGLEERRGKFVMLHAGAVADEQGRVAAFVGPSGRGKTTLSRHLAQHYGYVSDETTGVSEEMQVFPYRKPLSVVTEGGPKKQVSPSEAGMLPLPDTDLSLAALVLLNRDTDAAEPTLSEVPFVEAIQELVPQLSYLPELPRPLQRLAALCDAVGGIQRLRYPEAADVPPIVPVILDRSGSSNSHWEPCVEAAPGAAIADDVLDAIRVGDQIVVLVGREMQILDGIAPAIWDAVRRGANRDGILERVLEVHGPPEGADAGALVDAALEELIGNGVLIRS